MSKKLLAALAALLLVFTAGCSGDKVAAVSNTNETVVKVGSTTVTKGQVYDMMINGGGVNTVVLMAEKAILDVEVPLTEELETQAQETLEAYKSVYGGMFDQMLAYYGYSTDEEFLENALLLNARMSKLSENTIKADYSKYANEYAVKKASVLTFKSMEDASNALAEYNAGASIEDIAENASKKAIETVFTTKSTVDVNAAAYIASATETGMSTAILASDGESGLLVEVLSTDPAEFEDEAVAQILTDDSELNTEIFTSYLEKYKFTIYDLAVYNLVKENVPEYLVQK